jgi:hypothetical protein
MKKSFIATAIVLSFVLGIVAAPAIVEAQMGYGKHQGREWGPGYERRGDWNYCPYCGRSFHGGEGYGYGMGPGMMGRGHGHMYDEPRGHYYRPPREPLKKEDVKTRIENMLEYSRNPNLKVGKIEDKGNYFEAEITTKDGSLVDRLLVDKETGRMRSAY